MVFTLLVVGISVAHAKPSLLLGGPLSLVGPGEPGALLKGPSSATTLLGPDGSAITSSAIGKLCFSANSLFLIFLLGGAVAVGPKLGGVATAAVSPVLAPAG